MLLALLTPALAGLIGGAGVFFLLTWTVRLRLRRVEWEIADLQAELLTEKRRRAANTRWDQPQINLGDAAKVQQAIQHTPWWKRHAQPGNGE